MAAAVADVVKGQVEKLMKAAQPDPRDNVVTGIGGVGPPPTDIDAPPGPLDNTPVQKAQLPPAEAGGFNPMEMLQGVLDTPYGIPLLAALAGIPTGALLMRMMGGSAASGGMLGAAAGGLGGLTYKHPQWPTDAWEYVRGLMGKA